MSIIKYQNGTAKKPENPYKFLKDLYSSERIKNIIHKEHKNDPEMVKHFQSELKQYPQDTNLQSIVRYNKNEVTYPLNRMKEVGLNMKYDPEKHVDAYGFTFGPEGQNTIHVFPFKQDTENPVRNTYIHEMTHQIYPYTLGDVLNETLDDKSYINRTSLLDNETTSNRNKYFMDKSEKLARINELRYMLYNHGVYDAKQRDFNHNDYMKMLQLKDPAIMEVLDEIQRGSINRKGNSFEFMSPKQKSQNIIKLMNEIAQNKKTNTKTV